MKNKSHKKTGKITNPFIKSLIFGMVSVIVCWLLLTLVFSLIMSGVEDHTSIGAVLSVIVPVISLFAGGFAIGKTNKKSAFLCSLVLSSIVVAVVYLLSSALNLSKDLGVVMKTVHIASIFVSGVIGARLGSSDKGKRRQHRR